MRPLFHCIVLVLLPHGSAAGCEDKVPFVCEALGGHCTSYSHFHVLRKYCPKTCQHCEDDCKDTVACAAVKKAGGCDKHKTRWDWSIIERWCPRTCGLCKDTSKKQKAAATNPDDFFKAIDQLMKGALGGLLPNKGGSKAKGDQQKSNNGKGNSGGGNKGADNGNGKNGNGNGSANNGNGNKGADNGNGKNGKSNGGASNGNGNQGAKNGNGQNGNGNRGADNGNGQNGNSNGGANNGNGNQGANNGNSQNSNSNGGAINGSGQNGNSNGGANNGNGQNGNGQNSNGNGGANNGNGNQGADNGDGQNSNGQNGNSNGGANNGNGQNGDGNGGANNGNDNQGAGNGNGQNSNGQNGNSNGGANNGNGQNSNGNGGANNGNGNQGAGNGNGQNSNGQNGNSNGGSNNGNSQNGNGNSGASDDAKAKEDEKKKRVEECGKSKDTQSSISHVLQLLDFAELYKQLGKWTVDGFICIKGASFALKLRSEACPEDPDGCLVLDVTAESLRGDKSADEASIKVNIANNDAARSLEMKIDRLFTSKKPTVSEKLGKMKDMANRGFVRDNKADVAVEVKYKEPNWAPTDGNSGGASNGAPANNGGSSDRKSDRNGGSDGRKAYEMKPYTCDPYNGCYCAAPYSYPYNSGCITEEAYREIMRAYGYYV
ncbi:unnamed protein product [Bursaphelenchus xylophilus]|uniref:(pine wood nematode) hypothetical protein n=1 Tax=Bursaphelenchus xylophilus TaxID=6326 RepID=A0A7I8X9N8_BURXY|nr:unnamed protein product [Bursaphelenchus xylophilus]CAG9132143.1 unnamed protein product [Bursaphelenchus xylophilus]